MELAVPFLAVLLVSQAATGSHHAATTAPVRPSPNELAAIGVRLPTDTSGRFQSIGLAKILADAPRSPAQRLEAVQCYWRLWRAFADRAIAEKNLARLKPLGPKIQAGTVEAKLVAAEQSAAQAQLAEADLAIREAQVALCGVLGWNPNASMPHPLDPPHVGTYDTLYESIYRRRSPTARALLIHQTLPIYHAALGAHGTARQAADDMVAAQESSFQQQQINLETLLAAWQAQSREQKDLCRVTLLYNELIAEYAVPLAAQDMPAPELAAMLIRNNGSTASRRNSRADFTNQFDNAVEQADYTEPAPDATAMPPGELEGQSLDGAQTWAPDNEQPLDATTAGDERYPTQPEPGSYAPEDPNGGFDDTAPIDQHEPAPAATEPANEAIQDPFPAGDGSARYQRNARQQFAAKLVVETAAAPIFKGLSPTNASPRTLIEKMLPRTLIGDQGETRLPLSKCLTAVAPSRYAELLDAYVAAWRAASVYQADADSLAQVQDAQNNLLKRLADPNVAQDMLVLRAAETSYWARMIEDEAEIWRSMTGLGAVTIPRQPEAKVLPSDEPPVWAAAQGSASEAALIAKARSLVAVDAARAQASQETATTAGLTGLTLQAIERQNEETRGFLDLAARAAQENGTAILAQLGPTATATTALRALQGTATTNAARPAATQYRQ